MVINTPSPALDGIMAVLALCARTSGYPSHAALLERQCSRVTRWKDLPAAVEEHGLGPLVYTHLQAAQISMPVPVRRALEGLYLRHRRANAIRTRALREILLAFDSVGIEALVLKGAVLAHLVYPEPGLRPMRDLDIIVPRSQANQAQETLAELGFSTSAAAVSQLPANHYHLPPATKQVEGLHVSVEVHHHLFPRQRSFASPAFEDLQRSARPFSLEGTPAATLGDEDMLWHLYRHAFGMPQLFEPFRLKYVADMIGLVETSLDQIDWDTVKKIYPQVWNVLPLFHEITPWPDSVIKTLALNVAENPPAVVNGFQGWPKLQIAVQQGQGKNGWEIARDTLWPSAWWVRLYYGTGARASWWWTRLIRHPFSIGGWFLRYCAERFTGRRQPARQEYD